MTAPELPLFASEYYEGMPLRTLQIPHPGKTDTSAQAAEKVKPCAEKLRERCYDALVHGDFTADELADQLGEPYGNIRPRCSELHRDFHLIKPSGKRRKNASGNTMIVWTLEL